MLRKLLGTKARDAAAVATPARPDADLDLRLGEVRALEAAGHYGAALRLADEILRATPNDGRAWHARAAVLFGWGRATEARADARRAEALPGGGLPLALLEGATALQDGDSPGALAAFRRAVTRYPDDFDARFGLAFALQVTGAPREAIAEYTVALALRPQHVETLVCIGVCHLDLRDAAGAERYLRTAVSLQPTHTGAWSRLGMALGLQDDEAGALAAFEKSLSLELAGHRSDDVEAFVNLGIFLRDYDRNAEALALFERYLPDHPGVHATYSYAFALLQAGRLAEGFAMYETRWMAEPLVSKRPDQAWPVWDGQPLDGRTVAVRAEQGAGDTFQFVRFLRDLKSRGATVMLAVQPGLEPLMRGVAGLDRLLAAGEPAPRFDYYVSLMSLPRVLGINADNVPAPGSYLAPDPVRVARWRPRLPDDGSVKVGLVWAGNPEHLRDRYRSIPLATFDGLAGRAGVRWYSLQKGATTPAAVAASPLGLDDLGPDLADFGDTAAVLACLDLVICVDTAVAHLAGALGRPVWLLLPKAPDWRWGEHGEASAWYPSMRVFRQDRRGDWADVVRRVGVALDAALRHGGTVVPAAPGGSTPLEPTGDATATCKPGLTRVAETRVGIVQHFPEDDDGRAVAYYGEHLQGELALCARLVVPGATVVEVGSGVGVHALELARRVGPSGQLLLAEARSLQRRVLGQNLLANRLGHPLVLRRGLGRAAAVPDPRTPAPADACDTVDDLALARLDLLKVADPAASAAVLEGAEATLWRLRPALLLAATADARDALAAAVRGYGYRSFAVDTPLFAVDNFNRRSDDRSGGAVALAVLGLPEEQAIAAAAAGLAELRDVGPA